MKRPVAILILLVLFISWTDAQQEHLAQLRSSTELRLRDIMSRLKGVAGFAAVDLTSGERFGVNTALLFPQGSAIKIPVLMEVFRQAAGGKFALRDRLPVVKSHTVGGSGLLQYFGDSTSALSIRDLCLLMILLSDNSATNMLIDLVGMDNVNRTLNSLGMRNTKLQRRMMDVAASARGEENLSTPDEALEIMEVLYHGKFVSTEACAEMIDLLRLPKPGGFRSGIPDSVAIAFKPGGIAGVSTEWAIVFAGKSPFAVAFMENYQLDGEADAAMKEIAKTLYGYFWRKSRATRYGTYINP